MPHVQRLDFSVRVWDSDSEEGEFGLDELRMGHLPSLEEVNVCLWYREEDDVAVVQRVEDALRQAVEDHPNRLALGIDRMIMCWSLY
ncbi:hypothetical protein PR202_ga12148 [Eleusine coracana subsp. coracana]|uniref:Disease resistance R13L4/SHOC-2-like LRR domain-containing protein n=1 Tax=Eleusine coracana subsp. coracana TaxID=191504 RepID=A0AAV5CBH5_ELECO|nr:hypothetical protein PR202_ga12148 [Eleusine coracana subsp. coracana]